MATTRGEIYNCMVSRLPVIFSHLSHPFILDLGNLCISVPHHGDKQIDQQYHHDGQKQETSQLQPERAREDREESA